MRVITGESGLSCSTREQLPGIRGVIADLIQVDKEI